MGTVAESRCILCHETAMPSENIYSLPMVHRYISRNVHGKVTSCIWCSH